MAAVAFNGSGSGIAEDLESFSDAEGFRRDTLSRQLEDLERVRRHVTSGELPRIDPGRAGILGHSRGGGVALIHACEHPGYRAVATWAAVDTFDRHDEPTKELWRRTGELPVVNARTGQTLHVGVEVLEDYERQRERFDVLRCASRLRAPLLAVHGSADEAVDASALEHIAAACPADLVQPLRVAGAGHTFGARHPLGTVPEDLERVLQATVRFLAERVP
jgi:dienelactone hydrolase